MSGWQRLCLVPLSLALVVSASAPHARAQNAAAGTPPATAQTTAVPETDEQLDAEARQAHDLYSQGKSLAALPLWEDLNAHRPGNALYLEGMALAYVARGGASGSPAANRADEELALTTFRQVVAAGGKDDLTQVMIGKLEATLAAPADTPATGPRAPGGAFSKAEVLFNQGDLAGAVPFYKASADEFPKFYPAPLYAGDSEYKLGHFDEAGIWFARAIAIDPDIETAHRYWADCLLKAGKPDQAREQYIQAYIANPYDRAPRLELRAFAQKQGLWASPPIQLPNGPTPGKNGGLNLSVDAGTANDPLSPALLIYQISRTGWQVKLFHDHYPAEKQYRHSLQEESDSIHLMLNTIRDKKIPESTWTPTIRSLMALEKDGMLDCWILLDHPDQGIAQDYLTYRATHRDLLIAYVKKYDIHPA